ncbi:polymorphic toxin-type HINT domain-containing protein, partial [Streptomyces sp. NPDC058757]|uniref:polymorphic toxin-type HINT domain-containing protein n=1 Tax=Streptomyces sp. NPDC058757 TaxID=3346626 RepID=UPI00368C7D32
TKRYTTPFGAPRGTTVGTWPDDKTFLGKPTDTATGLTHIGAREYDPTLGQFISLDPLLSLDQHQSLNGYTYANQHPATTSDPTGLAEMCSVSGKSCPSGTTPTGAVPNDVQQPSEGGNFTGGTVAGQAGEAGAAGSAAPAGTEGTEVVEPEPAWWSNPFHEVFWGVVSNVPHTASLFGWTVDDDCWGEGGPGTPGCDYGGEFDKWVLSTGVDTSSGWYQLPGLVADVFGHTAAGAPGKTPKVPGGQCFLAGTSVLMADGSTKEIQDVEIGDQVLATDPETGETAPKAVTQLIRDEGTKQLNILSIETFEGLVSLTATAEHPFWSPSQKEWVLAEDLKPGMTLRTDGGVNVKVMGNAAYSKFVKTYNFTVDEFHTYYALAGRTPILVHNSCGPSTGHTRVYVMGRPGADGTPQDPLPKGAMVENGRNLQDGNYHYVVMPGGSVRAFHESVFDSGVYPGHSSLSGGGPVAMAGTFNVTKGSIVDFDNFSGHYRPDGPGMESVARDALNRNGFDATEATWDPFRFQ